MPELDVVLDTLFGDPTIARDALYAPTGGEAVSVRVVVHRPDEIVGFAETRIHTETTVFDVMARPCGSGFWKEVLILV